MDHRLNAALVVLDVGGMRITGHQRTIPHSKGT
jgi:hypothetical protein